MPTERCIRGIPSSMVCPVGRRALQAPRRYIIRRYSFEELLERLRYDSMDMVDCALQACGRKSTIAASVAAPKGEGAVDGGGATGQPTKTPH